MRNRAIYELIFAGSLWGFGFVATVWGLQGMSPVRFLFLRFLLSSLFAGLFIALTHSRSKIKENEKLQFSKILNSRLWRIGLPAGIMLGALLVLQTVGLQTISATQSGFITTLYVILVPIFQHLFFRKKQPLSVFVYAFLALAGVYLLTGASSSNFLTAFSRGHWLTFLCSLIAALHIIYVGHVTSISSHPLKFNTIQSVVCTGVLALLLPFESTPWHLTKEVLPWVGLLFTVFGSTLIAFTIQVRAQRILNPTTASMLFLLESPFAAAFGILFLQERLTWVQTSGAVIILTASYLTVRSEQV